MVAKSPNPNESITKQIVPLKDMRWSQEQAIPKWEREPGVQIERPSIGSRDIGILAAKLNASHGKPRRCVVGGAEGLPERKQKSLRLNGPFDGVA